MIGFVHVMAHCEECGATWSDVVPIEWDGTPPACRFCGELASVEVAK